MHGPLTRYLKLRIVHAPGVPGTFSPPPNSDSSMHHGMCVTYVPWCKSGLLTSGFLRSQWGKCYGIPGACATHNFTYLARGSWVHDQHCIHSADYVFTVLKQFHTKYYIHGEQNQKLKLHFWKIIQLFTGLVFKCQSYICTEPWNVLLLCLQQA